jgi:hypothetical protein
LIVQVLLQQNAETGRISPENEDILDETAREQYQKKSYLKTQDGFQNEICGFSVRYRDNTHLVTGQDKIDDERVTWRRDLIVNSNVTIRR